MPIVPVRLQWMDKQIFTYAMLDSCSTGTFITDETRKKRRVEGVDIEILIRTMNGQELHNTKAVAGLLISDISGKNAIQLPRTFTKEEIPASEKDIPQRELARKWKHPEQIADQIPDRLQDSEVGVLIGTNCPKAIEPRDFITKIMSVKTKIMPVIGILTRFRKEQVAFQADIEAMFHQVRVAEEHRDFMRFLWWPNEDLTQALQDYQMNVHLFGAFSSPSCANYAVRKTADDSESQVGKETADVLRRNVYVDDCLRSKETETKAIERIHNTIPACAKGGFRLTYVSSNSRKVLETIPEEDRSKEVRGIDLGFDDLPIERALGVQWHIESVTFGFKRTLNDKLITLTTWDIIYYQFSVRFPWFCSSHLTPREENHTRTV
ncbi:hypothetical protein QZH41_004650 [Actinostola sp. cb2023]|nr:hypothetical protein QZH41_004650 [Actinostola sp. cb2023]